jgi:23S rRNA (pseudouridine1915-N3)-methyltransferase
MNFHLLTVGRSQTDYSSLIDDYMKRINKYAPFNELTVQYKPRKNQSSSEIKKIEGEKILEKIPEKDVIFLLDERGKQLTSKGLALQLQKQMQMTRDCWFVIGGAYGFSDAVYHAADHSISLSKMTFNHQMVRLFFTEQVYRAITIIHKHPYHKS